MDGFRFVSIRLSPIKISFRRHPVGVTCSFSAGCNTLLTGLSWIKVDKVVTRVVYCVAITLLRDEVSEDGFEPPIVFYEKM
jgi:hypothetical protein